MLPELAFVKCWQFSWELPGNNSIFLTTRRHIVECSTRSQLLTASFPDLLFSREARRASCSSGRASSTANHL
ncbi:hypothetical protein ANCCAN_06317 [Ancylostoma caninum]|uniref:Uncharacterized protein n=1 Tax=Ancylostoma caninum TaxID=29170 RepID=A0A368GTE9_ANCCA|nr:hypothetical protein ANCCAN_06317 [Ancylostoma caninum]